MYCVNLFGEIPHLLCNATMNGTSSDGAMASSTAQAAVFVQSENPAEMGATEVRGPNFSMPLELQDLLQSYATVGFQATALSRAMEIVEEMVGEHLTGLFTRKTDATL